MKAKIKSLLVILAAANFMIAITSSGSPAPGNNKGEADYKEIQNLMGGVLHGFTYEIPKILHSIWFGSEIPQQYRENIQGICKANKDYRCFLWTDRQQTVDKSIQIKILDDPLFFDNDIARSEIEGFGHSNHVPNYGAFTDYFRLSILYYFGGVYLDTDVQLTDDYVGFGQLTSATGFLISNDFGTHVVSNAMIASCSKNTFVAEAINLIVGRYSILTSPRNQERRIIDVLEYDPISVLGTDYADLTVADFWKKKLCLAEEDCKDADNFRLRATLAMTGPSALFEACTKVYNELSNEARSLISEFDTSSTSERFYPIKSSLFRFPREGLKHTSDLSWLRKPSPPG